MTLRLKNNQKEKGGLTEPHLNKCGLPQEHLRVNQSGLFGGNEEDSTFLHVLSYFKGIKRH